jgi:hypothetical protein
MRNVRRVATAAVAGIVLACGLASMGGCTSERESLRQAAADRAWAEQSQAAIVGYIRANPGTFVGNLDPDKLKDAPLLKTGDRRFVFGAFRLDAAGRAYRADISIGEWRQVYDGVMETDAEGGLRATQPKVTYIDKSPRHPPWDLFPPWWPNELSTR